MCCDIHCGTWHWWGNISPCSTSKADCKHCLLLHIPSAPTSSNAHEKMTTFGSTEPHHSSWQCKESRCCCCHGPLVLLAMRDSRTSTLLTQYESLRLRSLCQSERTTVRDPVQHKRRTIRAICTDSVWHLLNIWKKAINNGVGLYWRYINVVVLWIKPCQKYRTVAITFYFQATLGVKEVLQSSKNST